MTRLKNISLALSCGRFMLLTAALMLVPLLVIPFYPDNARYAPSFLYAAGVSLVFGLIFYWIGKQHSAGSSGSSSSSPASAGLSSRSNSASSLQPSRKGLLRSALEYASVAVLIAWFWCIGIGALPFWFAHLLRPVQALFESVSGWTTAGLSVLDVQTLPAIYLFYRSFLQFCGGFGIVLVMVMIISASDSMSLFEAEGHPDKLAPNLKKTAQTVLVLMLSLLAAGTIAYMVVGMSFFDAINHAMCALSTGGFSTKLNSIGEYSSLPIEIVTIILMFAGTTNFAVLLLFAKGKWREFFKVSEIRFLGVLLIIFVPLIAWSLSSYLDVPYMTGLRQALFNVISALSTTGYGTADYATWSPFAIGAMILLMLIGGGLGSTAGGLKLSRVLILIKSTWASIKAKLSPAGSIHKITIQKAQGKTTVTDAMVSDTISFVLCYLILFIIGSLILSITAESGLMESMFEFASALGTVGLSIGLTGPFTNNATLIVEMVGMLFGRLEIFVIIIGITTGFRVFGRMRQASRHAVVQS